MKAKPQPLVSVVTPVYNESAHLAESIESVLAQTHQNWEYTIVDNCSTDGSSEIARRYAANDSRIRVIENQQFLRVIPNHNFALRQISSASKYCKMVFGDDWMFPECLEQMISLAEEHPSVGIVGAYSLYGGNVLWQGLPRPTNVVSGRDICRQFFLEKRYVFGTANSVLYRADLVRSRNPFYNEGNFHADMEVCLDILKTWDFGFTCQVLTFSRERLKSLRAVSSELDTYAPARLHALVKHGPYYLSPDEYQSCKGRLLSEYYNLLAVNMLQGRRDDKFWSFHRRKLSELGMPLSRAHLAKAAIKRIWRATLNPSETMGKLRRATWAPDNTSLDIRVSSSEEVRGDEGELPELH